LTRRRRSRSGEQLPGLEDPPEPRRRRVEIGLDRDLSAESGSTLGPGARAHLRAGARAVDTAELEGDPVKSSKALLAYLELRQAYGLAGSNREPLDPFAAFVAGLAAPGMGDTEDT
jgi:hypothetical protein